MIPDGGGAGPLHIKSILAFGVGKPAGSGYEEGEHMSDTS